MSYKLPVLKWEFSNWVDSSTWGCVSNKVINKIFLYQQCLHRFLVLIPSYCFFYLRHLPLAMSNYKHRGEECGACYNTSLMNIMIWSSIYDHCFMKKAIIGIWFFLGGQLSLHTEQLSWKTIFRRGWKWGWKVEGKKGKWYEMFYY